MKCESQVGCTQIVMADLPRHHIDPKSMEHTSKTHAARSVHLLSNRDHVEGALVLEVSMVRFVLAMAMKLEGWRRLVIADTSYLGIGYGEGSGICKPVRCGAEVAVGWVAVQE